LSISSLRVTTTTSPSGSTPGLIAKPAQAPTAMLPKSIEFTPVAFAKSAPVSEPSATFDESTGVAARDVVSLRFLAAGQDPIEARRTPPWRPDVPGAEPLRLLVAVNEHDIEAGDDGVQMDEGLAL
jgi:hypothetical protein